MASFMKVAILIIYLTSTSAATSYLDEIISDDYQDEILDAKPLTRHRRSNYFSGHDPEGDEVLSRLNAIMSNSSISERSKRMLEAAIGNIGKSDDSSSPGSSLSGRILGNGHGGSSNPSYRSSNTHGGLSGPSFRSSNAHGGSGPSFRSSVGSAVFLSMSSPLVARKSSPTLHATECCCKVNIPPKTERRASQVKRFRFTFKTVRNGNRKCGFWGWRRCSRYIRVLESHPYTETVYTIVQIPRPCPSDKEVCCRGYVAYKRCCTNIREMKRLLDLFDSQRDQFESLRMFLISQGHNPDAGCPLSCGP